MRIVLSVLVATLVSCATTPSSTEPAPSPPPNACAVVASVSKARLPPPTPTGDCTADRTSLETGCTANEPLACHRTGVCLIQAWGLRKPGTEGRVEAMKTAIDALGRACRAGMAESCVLRAGARTEFSGEAEAATCDDMVRACHLGDEANGCLACLKAGCS